MESIGLFLPSILVNPFKIVVTLLKQPYSKNTATARATFCPSNAAEIIPPA